MAPYRPVAYQGSALALYALRREVGLARFIRIERSYLRHYADATASTEDYLRVVKRVAGHAAADDLRRWVTTDAPPDIG